MPARWWHLQRTVLARQLEALVDQARLAPGQRVLELACGTATLALMAALPYPDASFDRVLCSLFFHHLAPHDKERTAREVFRVLRPGGELHVADWGAPSGLLTGAGFRLVQVLDGFENTDPNRRGELPSVIADAGFGHVAERSSYDTVFGTMRLLVALRP